MAGKIREGETSSEALRSLGRKTRTPKKKLSPIGSLVHDWKSKVIKKSMICDMMLRSKVVVTQPRVDQYWSIKAKL